MSSQITTITANGNLQLVNHQQRDPVPMTWLCRLSRCVIRRLRLDRQGMFSVSFIAADPMRRLNRQLLHHDVLTDVLTFRYPDEPIIGEILVAPACARLAAGWYKTSYRQELARYVIHGFLHWVGYEDRTAAQQRRMHALEDDLLARCAQ